MSFDLRVIPADTGRAFKHFIDVPYIAQGPDPNWVPLLRMEQRVLLASRCGWLIKKNPFYDHADLQLFLALKNDKPVGRIGVIHDHTHCRTFNEQVAHFGFFDSVDDPEVAPALIGAAETAARSKKLSIIRGPFSPSINHECAFLIEGFETPPSLMMPYNPPRYPRYFEAAGYTKAMDLYSYFLDFANIKSDRLARASELLKKRYPLKYRAFDPRYFERDAMTCFQIYTEAWEQNWGQYPMTEAEFRLFVGLLKQIAVPDELLFIETPDGKAVGFSMVLPNINEVLIKIRDGRLFPFGWIKLLTAMRRGGWIGRRGLLLGLLKEWRGKGLNGVLYHEHMKIALAKRKTGWVDLGWMLETNKNACSAAEVIGGTRFRTFRIYEKTLAT